MMWPDIPIIDAMAGGIVGERIIVTGATGYLGSLLVPMLRGDNEIHLLVRNAAVAQTRLGIPPGQVHSDLETPGAVAEVFGRVSPSLVFHLATHYERSDSVAKLGAMVDANVRFGALVLEAASTTAGCDVVVTGSHFQFGGPAQIPASFYAATKNALCEIARYLQEARDLHWIHPVVFDVYGPGDNRPKLIKVTIDRVRAGEPILLPDPEPVHHFVYVDDVVNALIAAVLELRADPAANGRNVFVTSNELMTPSAAVAEIASVIGTEAVIAQERFELPPNSIMTPVTGARPLGWAPEVSLREGVRRILSDLGSG